MPQFAENAASVVEGFVAEILGFDGVEETVAVCIEAPVSLLVLVLVALTKTKGKKLVKRRRRYFVVLAGLLAWACGCFAALAGHPHLVLASVLSGFACQVLAFRGDEVIVIVFALIELFVVAGYAQSSSNLVFIVLFCVRVFLIAVTAASAAYFKVFADEYDENDDLGGQEEELPINTPEPAEVLRQPLLSTSTNASLSSVWSYCFDGIFLRSPPSEEYAQGVIHQIPPPAGIIRSHRTVLEEEENESEIISQLAEEDDLEARKSRLSSHRVVHEQALQERPTVLQYEDVLRVRVTAVCVVEALGVTDALRETMTGTFGSGRILYRIEVVRAELEGWNCVKSYAQLRELIKYAKRLNYLQTSMPLLRPKPNVLSNSNDPVWSSAETEALREADSALQALLETKCPAVLLFLETDVLEYDRAQSWDLVLADTTNKKMSLRWMACTREDDEKRRAESRLQLEKDAKMPTLNSSDKILSSVPDLTELAYTAAALATALLAQAGVPTDSRADVAETLDRDIFFGRLEPAEARLLKGGDGAAAYFEVTNQQTSLRSRFGPGVPSLKRRHASLPPSMLITSGKHFPAVGLQATVDELTATSSSVESMLYDHFDDGSSGGAWITLARLRHALLHTSAWRNFRKIVGTLRYARMHIEGRKEIMTREVRLARAATLVNLHGVLAFHCILAWGAGSGRRGSTQRCLDAARYALALPRSDTHLEIGSVSLASLEFALLRLPTKIPSEEKRVLGWAGLLVGTDSTVGRIELRAALLLSSGRAAGAPLFALPPKTSNDILRSAAERVLEASLDTLSQFEISLPHSFRRVATLAAARSWGNVAEGEGRRRRARRAQVLRAAGLETSHSEWRAAADDRRRFEREASYLSSSDEDDDNTQYPLSSSPLLTSFPSQIKRTVSASSDDDDEGSMTALAHDEEYADETLRVQRQTHYAIKNLVDFLLATGGPNTSAKLEPAVHLLATQDDQSFDHRLHYSFRQSDLRPALRLLPKASSTLPE